MIATMVIVLSIMTDQATGFGGPLRESWANLQGRSQAEMETKINVVPSQPSVSVSPQVRLTLANDGNFTPGRFSEWDLILETQTASGTVIGYLSHTTAACPASGQWSIRGIFADAAALTSEVVGPGLLSPGEEMVVILQPSTAIEESTIDRATFVAPNGVTARAIFKVATVLYVVDATDSLVYEYKEDGTFVATTSLSTLNGAAEGITTDLVSFWTADNADDMVYEYTPAFALATSTALHASNDASEGLTTDGCSSIWAVDDGGSKKVFKYTLAGAYVSDFDLPAANGHPTGITTDGTNIWVVDHQDAMAYKYTMSGISVSDFTLDSGNSNARGITTNGTNIWVVDRGTARVYKYTMAGGFVSSFPLIAANADPQGITAPR
jgi:glutamine cyclotransferase